MTSNSGGKSTSGAEIQGITKFGVWIFAKGKEYFLSYEQYPWFKEAKVRQILNVTSNTKGKFYWPDLDVDLSIDILESPDKFPLISKE